MGLAFEVQAKYVSHELQTYSSIYRFGSASRNLRLPSPAYRAAGDVGSFDAPY